MQQNSEFKLAVSVKEGVFLLELKSIIYLEGLNNYTRFFFLNQKPLLVAKTIREYEEILPENQFVRVHKSFLVNKSHITRFSKDGILWMCNGVQVPVSRRKRNVINDLLSASGEKLKGF